jgi:hypothetical protein
VKPHLEQHHTAEAPTNDLRRRQWRQNQAGKEQTMTHQATRCAKDNDGKTKPVRNKE